MVGRARPDVFGNLILPCDINVVKDLIFNHLKSRNTSPEWGAILHRKPHESLLHRDEFGYLSSSGVP